MAINTRLVNILWSAAFPRWRKQTEFLMVTPNVYFFCSLTKGKSELKNYFYSSQKYFNGVTSNRPSSTRSSKCLHELVTSWSRATSWSRGASWQTRGAKVIIDKTYLSKYPSMVLWWTHAPHSLSPSLPKNSVHAVLQTHVNAKSTLLCC